jgi:nitrile hydratase subunit beta
MQSGAAPSNLIDPLDAQSHATHGVPALGVRGPPQRVQPRTVPGATLTAAPLLRRAAAASNTVHRTLSYPWLDDGESVMDGIHDLGGKQGFGAVCREPDEPAFHERWEARVFASMRAASAAGVVRSADQLRHAIERIDPVAYLTHGYYGRWLGGVETLLREAGQVRLDDLEGRIAQLGGDPTAPAAARPEAPPAPAPPRSGRAAVRGSRREVAQAPAFAVGGQVRTAATGKRGHTRLPAYARGRTGTVTAHHGGWIFPDTHAHGHGECPTHLYTVAFTGEALWGEEAEPGVVVSLDLFEPYLEAVPAHREP